MLLVLAVADFLCPRGLSVKEEAKEGTWIKSGTRTRLLRLARSFLFLSATENQPMTRSQLSFTDTHRPKTKHHTTSETRPGPNDSHSRTHPHLYCHTHTQVLALLLQRPAFSTHPHTQLHPRFVIRRRGRHQQAKHTQAHTHTSTKKEMRLCLPRPLPCLLLQVMVVVGVMTVAAFTSLHRGGATGGG